MKQNIEQEAQRETGFAADASRAKLADVYAVAAFGACEAQGVSIAEFLAEFDEFVELACDAFPKFEEILASPMVPVDEKYRVVDSVCRDATPIFKNFLKTLAKRGRTEILRDVRRRCRQIEAERKGRVAVRVTTATPLSEDAKASLAAKLRKLIGGEPELFAVVDPELIGEVLKVIRSLAEQKTTMIIVTHEMAFARDVADQVIFMDGGVIVEQGDPKQVIDHPKEERTKKFLARYSNP